jgi:UDP-N-acetylglucosamine transferase subunit ALG13
VKILVTVGNAQQPFDRLLSMIDPALAALPEKVDGVCQIGPSRVEPRGLRFVKHLDRVEFDRQVDEVDVVICHGGVGSLASAIARGHLPIALARRVALGEIVVNDHQLEVIAQLAKTGQVLDAEGGITGDMLIRARDARRSRRVAPAPDLRAIERAFTRSPVEPRIKPMLRILASLGPPVTRVR